MLITEIEYSDHPHRLILADPSVPYVCNGCKQLWFGRCYECKACNFHIHKECALPSTPVYHRFFKERKFDFHKEPLEDRECDGCGKDVNGFMLQCSCMDYDLHPQCAKLPETLTDGKGVTLELKKKASSKCLRCKKKKAKGWSYVSTCGNYCFHVACVKELIYEAWEKGYFDQGSDINEANTDEQLALEVAIPSSSKEIVQHKGNTGGLKWKMVTILQLIIAGIFGDPITAMAALVVALIKTLFAN